MSATLESFLKEVEKYVSVKEPTLFAVGGRGYYENPATDLLAFFLNPQREHGLGDLFLSTYLDCMKQDYSRLEKTDVNPQVQTNEGNFIDLQILGEDWCLLIENKINHLDANPFPDYENHAKGLGKPTKLFSILSRDGHDNTKTGTCWVGVSYKSYCQNLRQKIATIFFASPFSKWHIFAREFILHLENELYPPPMTPGQAKEVEKYADQIAEAEELAKQYREFILQELKRNLEKSIPGNEFNPRGATWYPKWWVFYCRCPQWNNDNNEVVLYKAEGVGQKFFIRAYLANLSESQLSIARERLKDMSYKSGRAPNWTSPNGYDSSEEAIIELCNLAQTVNDLLK